MSHAEFYKHVVNAVTEYVTSSRRTCIFRMKDGYSIHTTDMVISLFYRNKYLGPIILNDEEIVHGYKVYVEHKLGRYLK